MKKFIFIIVFLITILLSTFTVYADTEDATEYTTEDIYNSQYEQSGAYSRGKKAAERHRNNIAKLAGVKFYVLL